MHDGPDHLDAAGKCHQVSRHVPARIGRVFEQGERFEGACGTERTWTKRSQELAESLACLGRHQGGFTTPFVAAAAKALMPIPRSLKCEMNWRLSSGDMFLKR